MGDVRHQTARKPKLCKMCRRVIKIGERYLCITHRSTRIPAQWVYKHYCAECEPSLFTDSVEV